MTYTHREKRARNQAVMDFTRTHPDYALSEIAQVFNISRQRIHQILQGKICENCFHGQNGSCSCRDALDVIHTPNKCSDWRPQKE